MHFLICCLTPKVIDQVMQLIVFFASWCPLDILAARFNSWIKGLFKQTITLYILHTISATLLSCTKTAMQCSHRAPARRRDPDAE